ncbi:hypothetical protein [Streptomyces sp. NPDC059402]|uniref:hypothetical protein n=1 Tax=Streptomyces sp. NPDC059402 TaxID=3346822 RepID=UPI0036747F77
MNQETITAPGEPIVVTGRFRILFPTTARGAHTARHAAERWRRVRDSCVIAGDAAKHRRGPT